MGERETEERKLELLDVLSKFRICTRNGPYQTVNVNELFKKDTAPELHMHTGGFLHNKEGDGSTCAAFAWSTTCLYAQEKKTQFLSSETSEKGVPKKKKVIPAEALAELCDYNGYDEPDAYLWRRKVGTRPGKFRLCSNTACCNPMHREAHRIADRQARFQNRLNVYASRCREEGVVDQALCAAATATATATATAITAAAATATRHTRNGDGAQSSTLHASAKRRKIGKGNDSEDGSTDSDDAHCDVLVEPTITVVASLNANKSDDVISCGHSVPVGWVQNVKVWVCDKHLGHGSVSVILDFTTRHLRHCNHGDDLYWYNVAEVQTDRVRVAVSDTMPSGDGENVAMALPLGLSLAVPADVKYRQAEHAYVDGSTCRGRGLKIIDISETLLMFGGQCEFLNMIKSKYLECGHSIEARVLP